MKLTLFKSILLISLSLFVISGKINVGFITANLEHELLSKEELGNIPRILGHKLEVRDNGTTILKKDVKKDQDFSKLDIIMIAFQEAKAGVMDILMGRQAFADLKIPDEEFECPTENAIVGLTHWVGAKTATIVCYRKSKLELINEKTSTRGIAFWSSKDSLGKCFFEKNKQDGPAFCFVGGHFDLKLRKIGKMLSEADEHIFKKLPIAHTYVIGDLNTRLTTSQNPMPVIKKQLETTSVVKEHAKMDDDTIEEVVREFDSMKGKSGNKLYFAGNSSLRKLPFTYNYLTPKDVKENIELADFDEKHILQKKARSKTEKEPSMYNVGWLDRLVCISAKSDCSIEGGVEKVSYSVVPYLRKSDHMPIAGVFTINTSGERRKNLLKKN